MTKLLTLYSTSHCHLCELAHALLLPLPNGFRLEIIDIAEDEAKLAQYGTRIPVLHRQDTKAELNWPFSAKEVALLLK
jgi:Glutaredoxin-like domain (DUF836)